MLQKLVDDAVLWTCALLFEAAVFVLKRRPGKGNPANAKHPQR